jgi:hypothetical protein
MIILFRLEEIKSDNLSFRKVGITVRRLCGHDWPEQDNIYLIRVIFRVVRVIRVIRVVRVIRVSRVIRVITLITLIR